MTRLFGVILFALAAASPAFADEVRVKDLGRFLGWRDNALVGYGIVTGLASSGDTPRNEITKQALRNALGRLGANVTADQIQSRNVAAVMVTATLPPSAHVGDRIDVTVTSIGDARSLVGGSLLMTSLIGPDQQPYALAQGALVVGGYRFDADQNRQQKNYPASGAVPGGATVETAVQANLVSADGGLVFILKDPDVTTASRIADLINQQVGANAATIRDPGAVGVRVAGGDVYRTMARIENLAVTPASIARVVVNERSGTVVAGGDVTISSVVISQGDVRVSVTIDNQASQPVILGGYAPDARSLVVTNTKLQVGSSSADAVIRFPNTTVADLVEGLSRAHVDTRGVIAVLQAIKTAGALHADLVVQ